MLSNAYFIAKFRFDTAENEPSKNLQKFSNEPPLPPSARAGLARAEHGPQDDLLRIEELVQIDLEKAAQPPPSAQTWQHAATLTKFMLCKCFGGLVLSCIEADFCE